MTHTLCDSLPFFHGKERLQPLPPVAAAPLCVYLPAALTFPGSRQVMGWDDGAF